MNLIPIAFQSFAKYFNNLSLKIIIVLFSYSFIYVFMYTTLTFLGAFCLISNKNALASNTFFFIFVHYVMNTLTLLL